MLRLINAQHKFLESTYLKRKEMLGRFPTEIEQIKHD